MYQVIGIFLSLIIALLTIKMVYDIYKGNERIDNIGWCLIGVFVLDVVFNIWSILR